MRNARLSISAFKMVLLFVGILESFAMSTRRVSLLASAPGVFLNNLNSGDIGLVKSKSGTALP